MQSNTTMFGPSNLKCQLIPLPISTNGSLHRQSPPSSKRPFSNIPKNIKFLLILPNLIKDFILGLTKQSNTINNFFARAFKLK